MKRAILTTLAIAGLAASPSPAAGKFTAEQYQKALWMATRFYGAMRSGHGPNWILQDTEFPKSFIKDSYNGKDVSGGWFDCGDHVMFGQNQFYSTYVLATALDNFRGGLPDLYSGDYSDYKASKDYSINGGRPNGLQDLLEEIRYNADFIVKITPDDKTFVLQVGDGGPDHKFWVTAGKMATLTKAEGGESDGSRLVIGNPADGYAPGMAAAALAVMARRDPDAMRRATYLAHAKNAFGYSMTHTGVQSAPGDFYVGTWWDNRWREARVLAAIELWRTTGDATYKATAESELAQLPANNGYAWRLDYTNAVPLALLMAAKHLGRSTSGITTNLNAYTSKLNANGVTELGSNAGFVIRGVTGGAFTHALAKKLVSLGDDQFIYNQVDYILGANSNNQAFLVGWDEAGKKQPIVVHHRGYYGNTDKAAAVKSFNDGARPAPAKNKYLGGVIPGSLDGTVNGNIESYNTNEVCLEQNAPLVGALAYIVSQVAPVDTTKFTTSIATLRARPEAQVLSRLTGKTVEFASQDGAAIEQLEIRTLDGRQLWSGRPGSSSYRWTAPAAGVYVIKAHTASGWTQLSQVVP